MFKLIDLVEDLFSFSKGNGEQTHLDEHVTEQLGGLLGD